MDEYTVKVSVLKDALVATGKTLKESEIILITRFTLGGLGEEFESFVTSITSRYDPQLTFSELGELLMDQEMRIEKSRTSSHYKKEDFFLPTLATNKLVAYI